MKSLSKKLESVSGVVYIAPALPSVILFCLSMATAVSYNTNKVEYTLFKFFHPNSSEYLHSYLKGCIYIAYIWLFFYANMIIEFIPKLNTIVFHFFVFVLYVFGVLVWSVLGCIWIGKSEASDTRYYRVSVANVVIYFTIFGILIISIPVFLLLRNRKIASEPAKETVNPKDVKADVKPKEEDEKKPVLENAEDNKEDENK